MPGWSLVYDRYDPRQERLREALCTLGNGYFATRGAASGSCADDIHYPGTYLAGGYNRLQTELAGKVIENEDLVNWPNWLYVSFKIEGNDWLSLDSVEVLEYRQELDMKRGFLLRRVRFSDSAKRICTLEEKRLVHMHEQHIGATHLTLTAENWAGRVEVRSALDGRVVNAGVERYRKLNGKHLVPLETHVKDDIVCLKVETSQSQIQMAQAARTHVRVNSNRLHVETVDRKADYIAQHFVSEVSKGDRINVEKLVTLYSSKDQAISECALEARNAVRRVASFDNLAATQQLAWEQLWRRFDLEIRDTDSAAGDAEQILHLHLFHLLQTASMNVIDMDVGIPARGLHGEAYRGHIFWDELFTFPLFNVRLHEITRALLQYRYRRIDAARAAATAAGYRGAMYPWQSGSDGQEESQRIHLNPKSERWIPDNSRLQRHVNGAIVYNIWHYYQVTQDIEFLSFYGAEMVLEIARFWSSIASYNDELERWEILGVMGPDEYHDSYPGSDEPGLDNNAYTNVMAVWVLNRAREVLGALPEERRVELQELLDLQEEELNLWRDIAGRMRIVFHGDGIISQFEGYDRLEEFDWKGYREKYGDIQRLDRILEAENDTPNRYKASKQADVLMLFYLFSSDELRELFTQLGYSFEYETIPKNVAYYLQRTSHGSTLSRVVHSWILARSDRHRSWHLFTEALKSDVSDVQGGTTPEGIHLGAMAGTVNLIERGYVGIETRQDVLWFNPALPRDLTYLEMHMRYRGHSIAVQISHDVLRISTYECDVKPIKIGVKSATYEFRPGDHKEFPL